MECAKIAQENVLEIKMKPEIVEIAIYGWDNKGKKYDLSGIISDDTDGYLSDDIEEWRNKDE